MTENLQLPLALNTPVEASYNNGTTFTYTPSTDSSHPGINANTVTPRVSTDDWNGYYYYNWYAATAEKGVTTGADVDIDGSICPRGWKLPSNYTVTGTNPATGTNWSDMSWSSITQAYLGFVINTETSTGYLTFEAMPISDTLSGHYGGVEAGTFYNGGVFGLHWSSTSYGNVAAYDLWIIATPNLGRVWPQDKVGATHRGFPLRCLTVR